MQPRVLICLGIPPKLLDEKSSSIFLSKVYQTARKANVDCGTTGAFFHKQGQFLLVIEGEFTKLQNYLDSEQLAKFSGSVQLVLDLESSAFFFGSSPLLLSPDSDNDLGLKSLLNAEIASFQALQLRHKVAIENFFSCSELYKHTPDTQKFEEVITVRRALSISDEPKPLPRPIHAKQNSDTVGSLPKNPRVWSNPPTESPKILAYPTPANHSNGVALQPTVTPSVPVSDSAKPNAFEGCILQMFAWPDFAKVEANSFTIDLCAKLLASPHSYESLMLETTEVEASELNLLIDQLQKLEAITITRPNADKSAKPIVSAPVPLPRRKKNSFYNKMKSFIKSKW